MGDATVILLLLVAENAYAKSLLGWNPAYYKIHEIIDSAWHWQDKGL